MTDTMELAVIDAQNAVQIFTGGGLDAVLDGIEAKVRAIPLDPSTATGREEIRSVAYKVARTKVALDAEGKKLTEGWREATKKVNEERKRSTERLEALGEEVRAPLTAFENKEKVRVAAHEEALKDITGLHAHVAANPDLTADELEVYQRDLAAMLPDRNWEEFQYRAKFARSDAAEYLQKRIEARKKYEADQAELARHRAEEVARQQREHEERLKAQAAETARLEAERKAKAEADAEAKRVIEAAETERRRVEAEAERVRIENERERRAAEAKAKAELDKAAAEARAIEQKRQEEERAKLAAEQRAKDAEAARIAAENKAESDALAAKEQAKRDAEAAAARERQKIENERINAEQLRLKREADKKLRAKVQREIAEDLEAIVNGMMVQSGPLRDAAATVAEMLMAGKVRHCKVTV
jgi:hypothetical protein